MMPSHKSKLSAARSHYHSTHPGTWRPSFPEMAEDTLDTMKAGKIAVTIRGRITSNHKTEKLHPDGAERSGIKDRGSDLAATRSSKP